MPLLNANPPLTVMVLFEADWVSMALFAFSVPLMSVAKGLVRPAVSTPAANV